MPIFQCVQCCDCSHFQSAQARKDKKFSCKLCGKKQSVRKIIARSESGAEVRKVVQRLNLARGTAHEAYEEQRVKTYEYDQEYVEQPEETPSFIDPSHSRWRELAEAADIAEGKYEHPLAKEDEKEKILQEDEFVTTVPDLNSYSRGRRQRRTALRNRRRWGESSEYPAMGGVGKRSRQNVNASKRYNAEHPCARSVREAEREHLQAVSNRPGRLTESANAKFVEEGEGEGFFTIAGADVAFEEEVMP